MWSDIFLENEEKDLHIQKYSHTCGQGISYSRNPNILQNTKVFFQFGRRRFLKNQVNHALFTVKPLHNGHLGDKRECPLSESWPLLGSR